MILRAVDSQSNLLVVKRTLQNSSAVVVLSVSWLTMVKDWTQSCAMAVASHSMIGTKNVATGAIEFTGYFSSVEWGTFESATVPGFPDLAISTNTTEYLPAKLTVYFDGTYDDANGIKRQKLTSAFSFTADVIGALPLMKRPVSLLRQVKNGKKRYSVTAIEKVKHL